MLEAPTVPSEPLEVASHRSSEAAGHRSGEAGQNVGRAGDVEPSAASGRQLRADAPAFVHVGTELPAPETAADGIPYVFGQYDFVATVDPQQGDARPIKDVSYGKGRAMPGRSNMCRMMKCVRTSINRRAFRCLRRRVARTGSSESDI